MVRRLPVLQTTPNEDARASARPGWQWVAIGAGLAVMVFLPLSVVSLWLGAPLARAAQSSRGIAVFAGAAPVFGAYAISTASAGALMAQFGRCGARAAGLAGALAGTLLTGLAGLGGALSPWTVAFGAGVALIVGGALFSLGGAAILWRVRQRSREVDPLDARE